MIASELVLDYLTAERELISHALRTLQERTAITGSVTTVEPFRSDQPQADATIRLQHPNGTHRYWVECKSSIDRKEHLNKVRQQLTRLGEDGLLITPYLSRELAEYCRTIDLQFIDLSGNAYLHAPGLFVFMTGEKRSPVRLANDEPKGLTNSATLRVVFAVLSQPALLNSSFKSIAGAAGVSLGTAYNVLNDLQRRGYLIDSGGAGRRKLLEPDRLINEWAVNFPVTLRPKLHRRRFSAPDPDWWRSVQLDAFRYAWSSEVAACNLTGYLKPLTQTLYVEQGDIDSVIRMLVKQHRLKPDADGNIEILEAFWPQGDIERLLAPPLLVYAELRALMDPRADEAANMIKEKCIDPTFNQE
ncbi:type IV toxin-antitoxin system AbiEi family antitoxin [Janthinobacterium aquaticum]|uniref:type IV toxin-antitoxin system AbiEi family antitoxin n=1 Tax=Janthinobacterium sp. FT58W TaxID=2654254 RepID=UPI00186ACA1D|nr:type IV toxin-antitoxin system AbiEi family antitoxin [Janthinobacterium sp. FT58W]